MAARVALVTGGARGIPRAVALDLAARGVDVALCYRTSEADAASVVDEIERVGSRGLAVCCDVADREACESLVERVRAELGPPAIVVHGAGPFRRVPLLDETPEGWLATFDANLHPVLWLTRLAVPDMRAAGWGRLLTFGVAGAGDLPARPNVAAYTLAKAAVLGLTRSFAKELAPHGITANTISPGFVDSDSGTLEELADLVPAIPAGRPGTVEEVVAAARFLLSEEASYVTGTDVVVSGGWGL